MLPIWKFLFKNLRRAAANKEERGGRERLRIVRTQLTDMREPVVGMEIYPREAQLLTERARAPRAPASLQRARHACACLACSCQACRHCPHCIFWAPHCSPARPA